MRGSAPQLSVSDFVAVFNQTMDIAYPEVCIVGEVANFKISKNQWVYLDLKDEFATVRFFGSVRALPGPLEDGMVVEVIGKPYLHPLYSFSVQMQTVQPVGTGSINKALQLLTKSLEKEGLFDDSRKRQLPYAPQKIGLIASGESAAYGDFVKIINARWPRLEFELFDTLVQGKDAPSSIASTMERANHTGNNLEVLVVIRGGGSKDDLSAFDHEIVVRAIAASRIPTLVAIGHERDQSLSERVADLRASTPSNAAELLVPDRNHEVAQLGMLSARLDSLLHRFSDQIRTEVKNVNHMLAQSLRAKFDELLWYNDFAQKLLNAYDPKMPLGRGYVLVRNEEGELVNNKFTAEMYNILNLEFYDGRIKVRKA